MAGFSFDHPQYLVLAWTPTGNCHEEQRGTSARTRAHRRLLPGTVATQSILVASETGRPLWPRKAKNGAMQQEPLLHCPGSWLPAAQQQGTQGVLTLRAAAAESPSVGLQGSGLEACLAGGDRQQGSAGWLMLEGSELESCPQGSPAKGWGWVSPCHAWRLLLLTAPLQQHRTSGVWPCTYAGKITGCRDDHCRDAACWKGVYLERPNNALGLEQWQGCHHCTHRSSPAAHHLSTQRAPGAPWAKTR